LQSYIRWFSKQCNSLPDVVDADIVSVFLSGTTCKSLVHKLGCRKPRTTHELLDVATNHASGKEAVGAVFTDGRAKGKAKQEDQHEGPSSRQEKRKKNDQRRLNAPKGPAQRTNNMVLQGLKSRIFDQLKKFAGHWVRQLPAVLWSFKITPDRSTGSPSSF
jgi:hypothetical protein